MANILNRRPERTMSLLGRAFMLAAAIHGLGACVSSASEPKNEEGGHDGAVEGAVESHSGSEAGMVSASAACLIETSSYDQSCSVDSDCVTSVRIGDAIFPVESGDYCASLCFCDSEVISANAVTLYVADVSRTPLGSGAIPAGACLCAFALPTALCTNGVCALERSTRVDAGSASQPPEDSGQ
jgi:hypothetical protein